MNHAADYFTATMPEPWQILGLRLRPFSLGHYKLLRRFDCAFVAEESREGTRADLLLGVLCCSMLVDEFAKLVCNPAKLKWFSWLREWLYCSRFNLPMPVNELDAQLRLWGRKIKWFNLESRVNMFKEYIAQQSVVPKYWEEKTSDVSGAHWSQCLEVTLRSNLGWTQADIDTQPLSKAFADYFKYAENEGAIKLMTQDEIAFIESHKDDK